MIYATMSTVSHDKKDVNCLFSLSHVRFVLDVDHYVS